MLQDQVTLVRALQNPDSYDHPVREIELLETHISWVILTGEIVYKVKKAVRFSFLDFSTLEKRHFYCEEEVRLNRRYAPRLYLDVVAVRGSPSRPSWHGIGPVIEYAVRMRQFSQQDLLSSLASRQVVTEGHVDEISALVADMHEQAAVADADTEYGRPNDVHHWVAENFAHMRPALGNASRRRKLDGIEEWCEQEFRRKKSVLHSRKMEGFVRECHGDLHLGNLALIDGRITPFDCIEFNPRLRWIDVMSEGAFLMMDLQDRGYRELAFRFLNVLLQRSGDYAGVRVLRYYLVYRALVRAKVAVLQRGQPATQADGWCEYDAYVELAKNYADVPAAALIITHGVSGTGKSWMASRLAVRLGAIQVRSDVERKRLFGYRMDAKTGSEVQAGIYTDQAGRRTYGRLAELAGYLLEGGYTAIVDAAFLKRSERERLRRLAVRCGVPFVLLHLSADEDVLRARLCARQAAGGDASEAGIEVLEAQLASQEPLEKDEREYMLVPEGSSETAVAELATRIARLTGAAR